ncbi:hypothetical protein [Enterovibrio nigricans]|uniref:Tat (Twin-arginine translocation) pathway signal sequence n=1 Tax=Enterovibrio nigricans DSM 22720 TaxID=1121868 RepID=A0A1T4UE64_9GAMM|nr:hypothetical protein [Enterovibrio nigricans]PKF50726.1 Twin-arginine translocation pathway signal [Enterovibrio nigricans]SKA50771.1 hypothetical protein SAMN02745132_01464 [Enterovibrio nigricans DSM 22720]
MKQQAMSRRQIIKLGLLSASTALAYSSLGLVIPEKSWALTVNTLSAKQGEKLLSVCRLIYPHPNLSDTFYAASVESLDGAASGNPQTRTLIVEGLESLSEWESQSQTQRLAQLNHIAQSPFFQTVRGNMVVSFYDNPKVWPKFGYQGPSFPKGGYLYRGFDDIDWLPTTTKE